MYTNGIIAHKTEKDDFMFSVLFLPHQEVLRYRATGLKFSHFCFSRVLQAGQKGIGEYEWPPW